MRVVRFKSIYEQVIRSAGMDPTDISMSAAKQEFVADLINRRVQEGWEYDFWPELCVVEQRYFRDAWDATVTYAPGDERYNAQDGKYYTALVTNLNKRPDLYPATHWEEITALRPVLAFDPVDYTALGEVEGIYNNDPDLYPENTTRLSYVIAADGVLVNEASVGASVWVKFRRRPNKFTRVAWSGQGTYVEGDLVYFDTTGECYQAILDGAGDETWNQIDFPYLLEPFVVAAAAADYLRELGQAEKADAEEARAYKRLEEQYTRIFQQQGQMRRCIVRVE